MSPSRAENRPPILCVTFPWNLNHAALNIDGTLLTLGISHTAPSIPLWL